MSIIKPISVYWDIARALGLYTRYPIVARRAWPIGRVRRASTGILHTSTRTKAAARPSVTIGYLLYKFEYCSVNQSLGCPNIVQNIPHLIFRILGRIDQVVSQDLKNLYFKTCSCIVIRKID